MGGERCLTYNRHPQQFWWRSSSEELAERLRGAPTPRPTIAKQTFPFKVMDLLRNVIISNPLRKLGLLDSYLKEDNRVTFPSASPGRSEEGVAISRARQVLHLPGWDQIFMAKKGVPEIDIFQICALLLKKI